MIAFFRAHRADLDSLRDNHQAQLRYGVNDRDPELVRQWLRIMGRLELPGGGAVESTHRIFIPAGGRRLGRLADSKGFAWLDSIMPPGVTFDTLASLDTIDDRDLVRPGRRIRPLEGHWWLYRWTGEPAGD
ncbi:MAG TPA: hypothetical protein VJY35_10680 [Candidatus Eisenbacteria bacterium]|nr:hypothetical protein [Candidatus Eisenbacteria bacterium]